MLVPEAISEIRTLLVVAKAYIATDRRGDATKAIDEALALVPPAATVIVTNQTGAA